ncbi:MAG: hypothetical protein EHM41_08960, partial [Chloroflexi bacterium]
MNNTGKIFIGCTTVLIVSCLVLAVAGVVLFRSTGWVLGKVLKSDTESIADISESIAEYDLPSDFNDSYAARAAGFSYVAFTGDDNHSHIYLFQLPSYIDIDQEDLIRQAQQASGKDDYVRVSSKVVDEIPGMIAGQEVTLLVSEGVNHDGKTFREVSG